MRLIQYVLFTAALMVPSLALASTDRSEMRCEIDVHHKPSHQDFSAQVKLVSDSRAGWSSAVVLGKDPLLFTIGLSATTESPDILVAEVATGNQPEMSRGPGHAIPGTLIESTRVRFDGEVRLIFDLPTLGVTITCDPFAP